MNNQALIRCKDVRKSYTLGQVQIEALRGIDLQVNRGEQIAVLGPSGSGKSTLMNVLGCLDVPSSGEYWLDDKEVSCLSKNELAFLRNYKIGFIFQSFNLLAQATALENVALPLLYRGVRATQRNQQARQILEQVGLGERLDHLPNQLSGGQRQRVAIARALITDPDLILADEPTGNLDTQTGKEILQLFAQLAQRGKTILTVTHDLSIAKYAARVIHICDGLITSSTSH